MLRTRKSHGQGIIEYAGALVMAAILVATALSVLPGNFTDYFWNIFTAAGAMMTDFLNSHL